MVMVTVPQPATADVPPATPGVPLTASTAVAATASVDLDTVLQNALIISADTQWGLFNSSNAAALTSSHVNAVDMTKQYRISDAPIENGGFLSYNKVKVPAQVLLEVVCDGSTVSIDGSGTLVGALSAITGGAFGGPTIRTEFMSALDALVADLNLYSVMTPENVYTNMNVIGYNIRRATTKGLTMLYVDIQLQEVRLVAVSQITQTMTPAGQAQQNGGNVQSATPTAAQTLSSEVIT